MRRLNDSSLFYHAHICHDEFIFGGGDSWRSDNAWGHDCQTYCGFDFGLRSWLQSGWFPWWDEFIGLGRSSRCPACTRCALNLPKHCALFGGRFVWKSRQNDLFFSPLCKLVECAYFFLIDYVPYSLLPAAPFLFTEVLFSTGFII